MTTSREASMKFRAFCTSKKKDVWTKLIFTANFAKDIEKVYDVTTMLQSVQQECMVFALTHDVGTPDVYDCAELIFPAAMQKVVIKTLRPYFLSHWSIYRLINFNPNRKLDHGVDLNEAMYTEEKKQDYLRYLTDFNAFVHELKNGIMNANRHLNAAISLYIRELAAALVVYEMNAFGGELRCSWLQECMESLRQWADHITCQEAFHLISETIYKDVFELLSKNAYTMVAVDFPDKFRGIITMKYCLLKTNNHGREDLTAMLIEKVEENLLIASVDTKAILKSYAACVESLREMDSSCVVMHKVCGVIREYLKKRPDTVQQIITYITSNKKDELEKDMDGDYDLKETATSGRPSLEVEEELERESKSSVREVASNAIDLVGSNYLSPATSGQYARSHTALKSLGTYGLPLVPFSSRPSSWKDSKTVRSAMMDEDELKGVNDDFLPENMETMGWEKWMPNPIDTTVGDGAPGRQGVDVFNMLVSVYGSKELFVKEYRTLLAERLSGSENKDPYFEKRYLDLLKLRFQYSELQHCEVMLRDVMHSQEVDAMIDAQKEAKLVPVSACIISSHYWPKLEVDKTETKMPVPLELAMVNYQQMFLDAKRDRKLNWMRSVG
uniref:CULLIN_2 domain-containing protein n=1 Tax=Caenorhabditis japonica TaxID=281687 RepID=A0A8R1DXK5_CAEJA